MKLKLSASKVSIALIMLIMTIVNSNLNWGKDHWVGIIEADGKGYYAYLPAIFIYNDLNFGFFEEIEKVKYYDENLYYDYRSGAYGKVINKYYCGTALAELPFFLIAHLSANLLNYDADGYSKIYPVLISIAALFYLLLGLLYLNSILRFYNINELNKSLVLITAVFGTNLFYYTVGEAGMSHIYSFAFISMFFYYSKQYFSLLQKKYCFVLAILLGIIVLIRPLNVLIVLILPFAAGDLRTFSKGIKTAYANILLLLISLAIFIGIVFIQLIIYKISTGHFIVDSYGMEGFNFLSSHIYDILFSYKKGLFLYTPIFLVSLTGGYFLWKSSRFEFYSLLGFLAVITYVLSSWWMWYYGGSFSSRVYVEYIPFFMILLAISLNSIKLKLVKQLYFSMIILLIIVCQIQTFQYRYYHIHWSEMNKEKYWDVFMRVDKLRK